MQAALREVGEEAAARAAEGAQVRTRKLRVQIGAPVGTCQILSLRGIFDKGISR
jgi:hypothetical protein